MRYIIGLVGSGKTTLYRKLNEEKQCNAVEIELPQSCIGNNKFINKLFKLYLSNPSIDCIIAHPYYLPKHFQKYIKENDTIEFLEIPFKERFERILKRSNEINSDCQIFSIDYLYKEEQTLLKLKESLNANNVW